MKNKYNLIIGIIITFLVVGSVVTIYLFYNSHNPTPEFDYLKSYEDNEYMPVYISEERMAKLYYNDYKYYLNNDLDEAYDLINEDYRNERFGSFNDFKVFVETLRTSSLDSYSVVDKKEKRLFYIRLEDGNEIIFATSGVMKYEIYFDDVTVPIE